MPVDRQAQAIAAELPFVSRNDAAHAPEHALEVELPFLQAVLGAFTLVPLLVGEASPREVGMLLGQLWGGPETLIVVSSDLSHFHDYETAQRLDAATAALIESGAWAELGPNRCVRRASHSGPPDRGRASRSCSARRLALCNSGDTAGGRRRCRRLWRLVLRRRCRRAAVNWFVNLVLALAGAYLALVAAMYFAQTWLIFPTQLAAIGRPELPPSTVRLEVSAPDGIRLAGVRLPSASVGAERAPVLLGFPGNAWNAEAMALTLHQLLPES